jgi:hypothetical protein
MVANLRKCLIPIAGQTNEFKKRRGFPPSTGVNIQSYSQNEFFKQRF